MLGLWAEIFRQLLQMKIKVYKIEMRKVNVKNAEKIFKSAIKLLNSDCPKKSCEWCDGK